MQLWKCTLIIKLIHQLIVDLPRGRTCNSLSGVVCPSSLEVSYQLTNSFDDLCILSYFHFLFGLELFSIPAQTGNGTKKLYTNCQTSLSVGSLPPEGKDIQLNNKELHVLPLWKSGINWQISFTICVHFQSCISGFGWNWF